MQSLLITISDTASVEARKTLIRNIGRSQQDWPAQVIRARCIEYFSCARRVWISKFYKKWMVSFALCHPEILQFLKANFSSNITPKEPNIPPVTKLTSFSNVCSQFVSHVLPFLRRMLMRKMWTMMPARHETNSSKYSFSIVYELWFKQSRVTLTQKCL